MKQRILIITALLLAGAAVLIFSVNKEGSKKTGAVGLYAPDFAVLDSIGGSLQSSGLRGKVLFVHFWATWCPTCKEELPSIESLYRQMSGNDKFLMIPIAYRDSLGNAMDYMKANGYTFPVFADARDGSAGNFGVTGVPETYLIDKKGILRKRLIGPAEWNSQEAKDLINSLLSE